MPETRWMELQIHGRVGLGVRVDRQRKVLTSPDFRFAFEPELGYAVIAVVIKNMLKAVNPISRWGAGLFEIAEMARGRNCHTRHRPTHLVLAAGRDVQGLAERGGIIGD